MATGTTRTEATERNYLNRAIWFEVHTAKHLGLDNPGPLLVAAFALERREEWSKSTWRQIKASLIFRYTSMGTSEAAEATTLLRDGAQSACVRSSVQTSARRAKNIKPQGFADIFDQILTSNSKYAALLETWLRLGCIVGLRPHEWGQAEILELDPVEIGDKDALEDPSYRPGPLPYLRIVNSKTTNGRSHGVLRHQNLKGLDSTVISAVKDFAVQMRFIHETGQYQAIYEGCRKLLFRINRSLHGGKRHKWIQLYSPRHKFSSEAKRIFGLDGVAALMGHVTTKTATQHYGRRSHANGTQGPRPIAAEIARVRKIRSYQARQNASKSAATPTQSSSTNS